LIKHNSRFLLGHLTTERSGELQWGAGIDVNLVTGGGTETKSGGRAGNGPFGSALKLGGLVDLCGKVQKVDFGGGLLGVGDNNQGVDLEVGELTVDVDGVKTGDEVYQDVVDTLGNLGKEGLCNVLI
jgi:hypothetical protein